MRPKFMKPQMGGGSDAIELPVAGFFGILPGLGAPILHLGG